MDMSHLFQDVNLSDEQVAERMEKIAGPVSDPVRKVARLRRWLIDLSDRSQYDQAALVVNGIYQIIQDHGLDVDETIRKIRTQSEQLFTEEEKGRVLVLMEKHGDVYILVETPKQLANACLKILKDRVIQGYYEWESEEYQQASRNQTDMFRRQETDPVEEARFILQAGSDPRFLIWAGKRAYRFLMERVSREYEGIHFAVVKEVVYTP